MLQTTSPLMLEDEEHVDLHRLVIDVGEQDASEALACALRSLPVDRAMLRAQQLVIEELRHLASSALVDTTISQKE